MYSRLILAMARYGCTLTYMYLAGTFVHKTSTYGAITIAIHYYQSLYAHWGT
jgi:hypothetical protein